VKITKRRYYFYIPHHSRIQTPKVSASMVEHRRRGRIYDRNQSDQTCSECERIATRDSIVPVTVKYDRANGGILR
jgi:hypothetical protein